MATHRKLTNEARFAIVRKLAAFQGPTEIAAAIQEEFGFEIRPQSIQHYDPAKSDKLAKIWADYFYEQRRKFLADVDAEAMESRRYRQSERRKLYEQARSPKLKATLLNDGCHESLAWEKLAIASGAGKRINHCDVSNPALTRVLEMTPDQRRVYLDEMLAKKGLMICSKDTLSPQKFGKDEVVKSNMPKP